MPQYFSGLDKDKQQKILDTQLTIYICRGEETEIKEWFRTLNIVGIPLVLNGNDFSIFWIWKKKNKACLMTVRYSAKPVFFQWTMRHPAGLMPRSY